MLDLWVNNRGFKLTATYHKTNLTFREAAFETIKDIRARTNKTLIVSLSGGSDSVLVYNIAKDLGIEVKTVHQRYWDGDRLINEYEGKNVDPDTVDVYQDIDCNPQGEYRTSQWAKETWEDYFPTHWYVGLQGWIKEILDPNNDFIIYGGAAGVERWDYQNNSIEFDRPGTNHFSPIGYRGFEYAAFLCDNPIILYTLFDQTSRNIMKNISSNVGHLPHTYDYNRRCWMDEIATRAYNSRHVEFDTNFKKHLFEHHFPEFNHLSKLEQAEWQWPEDFWSLRLQYGNISGCIPHFTRWNPMEKLDLFFDCIDNSVPISGGWYEWNWDLSDYGKKKLQYKIFTDKIEYIPMSSPQSENLI